MCGIAGIFNYRGDVGPVDPAGLAEMSRVLRHRGPDGDGIYLKGPIGLAHRRLAIVDLSETGKQPMATSDGEFVITYNGEFYDHLVHRDRLIGRGEKFRGPSDTETMLRMLAVEGVAALARISSIFGLGFWDSRSQTLTLARDAMGVKQVYYHDDGSSIVFASEIKAVLACRAVRSALDTEALNQYLHFHAPLFDRTFFRGIQQLLPGQFLEVSSRGVSKQLYIAPRVYTPRQETSEEAVRKFQGLMRRVVKDQLMSDVPVGAFFSGGIDSTAIAKYAKDAGTAVHCFGIHFSDQGVVDERPFQEASARALGLPLDLVTLDGSTFSDDLPRLIWFQDQPVIGPALVPMFHVSRLAAKHVKVCLGGQGADELFGGYARYALADPFRVFLSFLGRRLRISQRGHERSGSNLTKQLNSSKNLKRLLSRLRLGEDWANRYFNNFSYLSPNILKDVFPDSDVYSRERSLALFLETVRSVDADKGSAILDWDANAYLPALFQQDDRMSMANGLESRVPFADVRMAEFARNTRFNLKIRNGATKWVVRESLAGVVPDFVLNRRKVGFDTPVETWLRTSSNSMLRETLLSTRARQRGFWNSRAIEHLLDHPTTPNWFDVVWKLLCVEVWATKFLDVDHAHS